MTPFPYDGVLIDYGGTLDGDGIHWSRRFDRVFRAAGLEYSDLALQFAFRSSELVLTVDPDVADTGLAEVVTWQVRLMLGALGIEDTALAGRLGAELTAETRGFLSRNAELLRALRGLARVGVLSNFNGNLELILRQEGLRDLVDAVFDSGAIGLRKPDPAFFRRALGTLQAAPERSVMIGDSVDMDLRPAKELGLATVYVEGAVSRPTDFVPDATVTSVHDLLALWSIPG